MFKEVCVIYYRHMKTITSVQIIWQAIENEETACVSFHDHPKKYLALRDVPYIYQIWQHALMRKNNGMC